MAAAAIFAVSCNKPANGGDDDVIGDDITQGREVDDAMAGAEVWSIIGAFCDWGEGEINMTKVSDNPEKWFAGSVGLTEGEWKFRGNHEWGVYDLGAGGAAFIPGVVLDLKAANGNINCTEDATYEITLYPTLKCCIIKK